MGHRFCFIISFLPVLALLVEPAAGQSLWVDLQPGPDQLATAPEDGTTVSLNPPAFIWVPPAEDNVRYIFEISPVPDGTKGLIRVDDIPVSTVALTEPLAPGTWWWRYGVKREGVPTDYSRVRGITVPDTAQVMPLPNVREALGRVPQGRPRLFLSDGALVTIRDRAKDGSLAERMQALRAQCDPVVGAPVVPEPPPITGEGAARGALYAEVFRSTRPDMDRMEDCALIYLVTSDERFGQEARRRVNYFFSWNPEGSTAYQNNDEPAMWMMMRGVRAYDWTYNLFTEEERQKVEACMRTRAAQFYDHLRYRQRFHSDPFESHAGRTIGFLGEVALAFAHEWPEAQDWLHYVMTCYWNCYPAWGREDGGWHEGPSYWSAYMGFALHFVTALREGTGIDLTQKPFFKSTPYYLLYTNPPYAKISPFGDGEHSGSSTGRGHLMYWFSSLLKDPYLRWYSDWWQAGPGVTILGVVLENSAITGKVPSDLPPTRYFPGVGLVSLHTALGDAAADVHFLMHSDPYGAISHGHADQNAFTLEAFGEPLAIASGNYPWYGSDHHRQWQWESKSSNTITLDGGMGQVVRDPASRGVITTYFPGNEYDYVVGDATAAYQGRLAKAVRSVIHLRPGEFVLFDDVAAPAPSIIEWNLHSLSPMQLDEPFQTVTLAQGGVRCLVRLCYGDNLQFGQREGETPPPENGAPAQFHFTAYTPEQVTQYQVVTVMIPYRDGEQNTLPVITPVMSDSGKGVAIARPEGTHLVAFRAVARGSSWGVGMWESDADAFAVYLTSDNQIGRHIVLGGTHATETMPDGTQRSVTAP